MRIHPHIGSFHVGLFVMMKSLMLESSLNKAPSSLIAKK